MVSNQTTPGPADPEGKVIQNIGERTEPREGCASPAGFFSYARERHSIYLKRAAGQPRPWTEDPVLQSHRFTNVFRELDRVTVWFREHVRGPLADRPEVLLATVIFRWFNRVTTGEAIFTQPDFGGRTAFERFLVDRDTEDLRRAIVLLCGNGPYVTGAYTINTISAGRGHSKLNGVLRLIQRWELDHTNWREQAVAWKQGTSLRSAWQYLRGPCHGPFMSYEVVSDLRHTALLRRAPDILTWANAGPGAERGLNRVHGRPLNTKLSEPEAVGEMRELLVLSRQFWPADWPAWEMREVEHTLCEWDKYRRVMEGSGRPRGSFDGR